MDFELQNLHQYSDKDPRVFVNMINNHLLRLEGLETVFLDHYTIVSKQFNPHKITFLLEVGGGMNLDEQRILGTNSGKFISLISFLMAMKCSYEINLPNFIITTKKLTTYFDFLNEIETPAHVLCIPSSKERVGDSAIVGHYGVINCGLSVPRPFDQQNVTNLLTTYSDELLFMESENISGYVDSVKDYENISTFDIKFRFNQITSPTYLVHKYEAVFAQLLSGLDYSLYWELECMPAYYSNQNSKCVLHQIVHKYCDVDMGYVMSEKVVDMFKLEKPCIALGCIQQECEEHQLSEVKELTKLYTGVIRTNGGFY